MSRYVVIEQQAGGDRIACPVVKVSGFNEGFNFEYVRRKRDKKDKAVLDIIYVGRDYKFFEFRGEKLVGKQVGNNSACPITIGVSSDADCPGEDLSSLVRTDVLTRGYKTLYGAGGMLKWIIIAVIVIAVVIGGVMITKSFTGGTPAKVPAQSTAPAGAGGGVQIK